MNTCSITGTDLSPSVLCFGGGSICIRDGQSFAFDMLDRYLELGGNFIDTANVYGKWLPDASNISEQYIGNWMTARRNRNRIVLATKGGHPDMGTMHISRLSREEVLSDLEESLASLKTDCIDLYWLHRDDEKRPVEEILDYLQEFVRLGKIRWFGCSNWKPARIRESMELAKTKNSQGFVANQMLWSLAEFNPQALPDPTMTGMDGETWKLHQESQLAAIPYSSQAGGFFQKLRTSGKDHINAGQIHLYDSPLNDRRLEMLCRLESEMQCPMDELVLGYLLAQPFPVMPIIGARNMEQLESSMKAGERAWDPMIAELLRCT
jgi:aryl-alcohol dehydrogenase-like predicted oxidoreductase